MNRYVFTNFLRTLRSSWRTYLMAGLMIAAAYSIFGAFFLLHRNLTLTTKLWVRSVPVTLILEKSLSADDERLLLAAAGDAGADSAHIVTPEEGRLRLQNSAGAELLTGFEENPLPPMLELTFAKPPPASQVALMRGWPKVVEVDDAGRWSERFQELLDLLDAAGVFLGAILVFAAFTVASLGVRLVAANHAAEREIQHLVGAPPSFIRAPYLLGGALLGLVGAATSLSGLAVLFWAAARVPATGWPIPIHTPEFFGANELAWLIAGAIAICVAGSWAGTRTGRAA